MFDDKDWKRWIRFGKIICADEDLTKDLLQEILIDIYKKKDEIKSIDNYIFMSLRNKHINHITKKDYKLTDRGDGVDYSDLNEEYDLDIDYEKTKQLSALEIAVEKLDIFDAKLYRIHFIEGKSQRCISRESGISFVMINQRIKKIKEKIKLEYQNLK
ncbi:RpoE DNA-directed RNA polymerase specialized sigma subunit, sigma24 homolog [uncultured Caudovirales phage]|uniref:RpoE DNA-directed RNA polymerase specialized sigma subunit, sigma24 homolog n=1 Tax=uncultured Caudovirales phage TaxID=2100421 RepID=A0A6J5N296_9CAUD|nr:RpoE DNA-directed RNA polymerase specialized sigma subunit, sigma24 homolog [uncultured Caudovirales phage]